MNTLLCCRLASESNADADIQVYKADLSPQHYHLYAVNRDVFWIEQGPFEPQQHVALPTTIHTFWYSEMKKIYRLLVSHRFNNSTIYEQ